MSTDDLEGPGWYTDFLRVCGTVTPDDQFYEAAQAHIRSLPQGKLYAASVGLSEQVASVVDDLRTKEVDKSLLITAGTYGMDFGPTPWFTIFTKPVEVPGIGGRDEKPLVVMAWSPPDEFVFVTTAGDTGFLQWPRGESAGDITQRGEAFVEMAPWLLAAVIFRSAWLSDGYDFEDVTAEWMPEGGPAGGFYVITVSERNIPFIDAETQARWN